MENGETRVCGGCVVLRKEKVDDRFAVKKYWCARYECWRALSEEACAGYKGHRKCFLTTACVRRMGLPDDCKELTMIRNFRDEYLVGTEWGNALVEEYYRLAPEIIKAIDRRRDADEIYRLIYCNVQLCVRGIEAERYDKAVEIYTDMVNELKDLVNGVYDEV